MNKVENFIERTFIGKVLFVTGFLAVMYIVMIITANV